MLSADRPQTDVMGSAKPGEQCQKHSTYMYLDLEIFYHCTVHLEAIHFDLIIDNPKIA